MKVKKSLLINNLKIFSSLIKTNSFQETLSSIRILVSSNKIVIQGTDLKVFIQKEIKYQSSMNQEFIVDFTKFLSILQKISFNEEAEVELNVKKSNLLIKYKQTKFNLPLLDSKKFPTFPKVNKGKKINLQMSSLLKVLSNINFACSIEYSVPALCGVLFDFKNNFLNIVGSNSVILGVGRLKVDSSCDEKFILPKDSTALLVSENWEENVSLVVNENGLISFRDKVTTFIMNTIGEKYPNYSKVIPRDNNCVLKMDLSLLKSSIDKARILNSLTSFSVDIILHKNKLVISKHGKESGEFCEELKVDYKGKELKLCLNSNYFIDLLSHISNKEVEIRFKGNQTACLLKTKGYVYLFLPMLEG